MRRYFVPYCWIVLVYTIGVILWGAMVRITGSGAGCGSHWPTCNGEIIPLSPNVQTMIEYSHRITSGLSLLLVIGLFIGVWRIYSKDHPIRRFATLSLVFIIVEALVGAMLVLLELVGNDSSAVRALVIALHQANTFLLLGALVGVCYLAQFAPTPGHILRQKPGFLRMGFVMLLITAATGAVVALGDTLFPSTSLVEGIIADFSATSHFLVRLRIWHPIVAVGAAGVLWFAGRAQIRQRCSRRCENLVAMLQFILIVQLCLGVLNIVWLAPTVLQIAHLAVADLLLVVYVALMTEQSYCRQVAGLSPTSELLPHSNPKPLSV